MTAACATREDILTAARRSYGWLQEHATLVAASSPHALNSALEWLIATWICEQAFDLDTDPPLSREGARQVARRLDARKETQAFDELFNCDALRVVLAHAITARHDVASASLGAFVSGLAASLPSPQNPAPFDDMSETRVIVALAGRGPVPCLPSLDSVLDAGMLDLLQADEVAVHRVASQVMTATAYGTCEPKISTLLRRRLIEVLPVWLLDFARRYRLDNVALVMRSLNSLGESSAVHDALGFLLAQQHPSGHFGFFGPEAGRARRLSPDWCEAESLQLPMTFGCLWAISESIGHGFRLLGTAKPPRQRP